MPNAPSPVPPAPQPETTAEQIPPRLPTIQFTIQVGAFSTVGRAANYADRMQAAGLDAYYFIDSDNLFKVRFERFTTKEAARERALSLKASGLIDAFFIAQPGKDRTLDIDHSATDPEVVLQERLVDTARRFIGTPYRWGGDSIEEGFDCSGLTMTVYRLNGLDLPRNAYGQYHAGAVVSRNRLRPGDLVFFATGRTSRISHVGIYSGKNQFIHAPGRGKRIRTASLSNTYFKQRYKGARRYY